jgi:hypothetical protein
VGSAGGSLGVVGSGVHTPSADDAPTCAGRFRASGHIEDGVKLGGWVAEQRAERRNLSPGRVAQLEALPGWSWTVSQDIWGERCALAALALDTRLAQLN